MLLLFIFKGEFGDVFKGKITKPDENVTPVAVKTLKVNRVHPLHFR